MIARVALRSLSSRPVRSAVLACGFGLGVSVMATLLGVGAVVLEQARAPALHGGGHLVVTGATGEIENARFVLSSVLGREPLAGRLLAAAPTSTTLLYLVGDDGTVPLLARGGIPSLERALGDSETAGRAGWSDTAADGGFARPDPAALLVAMDRFHAIPDVPERAGDWAEWLYFNGSAPDARFYLTFFTGPRSAPGKRVAGVHLQLDVAGRREDYGTAADVVEAELLESAPDLRIGESSIRVEGLRYRMVLRLRRQDGATLDGEITLDHRPGLAFPPLSIRGARGWVSGYTVPVMAGPLGGELRTGRRVLSLAGGSGYHDHNWGFFRDVTWQWGQAAAGELAFLYGRIRPPADAADPERMPGLLAVLGPSGPLAIASSVHIEETGERGGAPRRIVVTGRGGSLDVRMELDVDEAIRRSASGLWNDVAPVDFYQLRATYRITGSVGERQLDLTTRGAAETFRRR